MPADIPPLLFPLVALYPEIHYRFKAFPFSRYFRRQPEIIADAPHRLEPGQPLPIFLLIKDADHYPVTVESVKIEARGNDTRLIHHINIAPEAIKKRWWHHTEWIELPDKEPCIWDVSVTWQVRIGRRSYLFETDNLPGLSHGPLKVRQSGSSLPCRKGWVFGDLHAHTAYTEDQVEFGAPLAVYPLMGGAAGLSFALAADHSYDLDDMPGSFSQKDPDLVRFHYRSAEIERLNREHKGKFSLLPGYELSASNSQRKNIHLLLLNQRDFLPGSGDSAERWLRTKSEFSITKALERLNADALPIAAHPMMNPPRLEKWLLGRGHWGKEDLKSNQLFGLQVWNGGRSEDFRRGIEVWVEGLLTGKRWKILAGSDAHGNFNRNRQVGFPMLKLAEREGQIFGEVRTGVLLTKELSVEGVIQALKSKRSLVTDGPFADMDLQRAQNGSIEAAVEALSTVEFGALSRVRIYRGKAGEESERILNEKNFKGDYQADFKIQIQETEGYLRLEVMTDSGRLCLTNPLFLSAQKK